MPHTPAEPGTLVGDVRDRNTQAPIHHAWVKVDDDTTTEVFTDRDGRFRVPAVAAGHHVLNVSFIGYRRAIQKFTMPRTAGIAFSVALNPVSVHGCGGFGVPITR